MLNSYKKNINIKSEHKKEHKKVFNFLASKKEETKKPNNTFYNGRAKYKKVKKYPNIDFSILKNKKIPMPFICLIVIVSFCILNPAITSIMKNITLAFGIYTEEIPSIEFESSGYSTKEQGSWHIDKSASWTDSNKAEIIFDVNSEMKKSDKYKDVKYIIFY